MNGYTRRVDIDIDGSLLQAPIGAGCCTPVVGGVLSVDDAERLARLLRAVADPTRLRLVSIIAAHEGAEACVCDLIEPVGLTQGTVSHHLRVLVDAGVLSREQRGRWAYYSIVDETLKAIASAVEPHPVGAL
jgi:ArsR family transcriptional regulator, arsenate/arsenite/antimonite-responsive transcriptional repressor